MSEPSEQPPKIIVDDDWKSQVEKEKREAAAASSPAAAANETASADQPAGEAAANAEPSVAQVSGEEARSGEVQTSSANDAQDLQTPPPATFEVLVTMLFTQAMASLGQLPGPDGKMGPVNKPFAKYFIDSVELLGEKTKGNLSDEESKMISEALHAMRMAFVSVKAK